MTRQEALSQLTSEDAHTRLLSARALAGLATVADANIIEAALKIESDPWARRALELALLTAAKRVQVAIVADGPSREADGRTRDPKPSDLADAAAELLHEAGTILGVVDKRASEEIDDYDHSDTKNAVDRMRSYFRALQALNDAGSISRNEEFVLSALVNEVVSSEGAPADRRIVLAGPESLVVVGDRNLVGLILRNGLKNALEATLSLPSDTSHPPVLIAWDETDRDYWVAVLDRGPGLAQTSERAMRFRATTKSRDYHFGAGLTIAKRAAESLGGEIALTQRAGGGVAFGFRWPTEGGRQDEGSAG